MMRKNIFYTIVIIVFLSFIGACGGTNLNVKPIATSENPTNLINRLENDLSTAYKNQLNVLSPTWLDRKSVV